MTEITPPTQAEIQHSESKDWHATFSPTFWESITMGYMNGARRQLHRHTCVNPPKDVEVILDTTRSADASTIFMPSPARMYLRSDNPADNQLIVVETLEEARPVQHIVQLAGLTPVQIGTGNVEQVYFAFIASGGPNQGTIVASPINIGVPIKDVDVILLSMLPGYGFANGSALIVADDFAIAIPQLSFTVNAGPVPISPVNIKAYFKPADLDVFVVAGEWNVTSALDNTFTLPFFLRQRDALYFTVTAGANNLNIAADLSYADLDGTSPLDTAGAGFLFQGSD